MREPAARCWLSPCSVLGALALLYSLACGKATRESAEGAGSGEGVTGGALPGGASPGGTGAGGTGAGGNGMVAGQGGTGAVSAALPGATEDERAVLEALFVDPAEIEAAELQQLLELGASIGLARGYAMCRCTGQFTEHREVLSCARAETGLNLTRARPGATVLPLNQDLARCLQEESVEKPWLADALRCELVWIQENGRDWLEGCSLPAPEAGESGFHPQTPRQACLGVDQAMRDELDLLLILKCRDVAYCDDGTRVSPGRCSGTRECSDWSDERNCFDLVGYDMVRCGEDLGSPRGFCSSSGCGVEIGLPLCSEDRRPLQCPDGTALTYEAVCNRTNDCADGADELHCFR